MGKKLYLVGIFVLLSLSVSAQFSISGKLRTLKPTILKVEDLNGKVIVECDIKNSIEFKTKKVNIVPDLYKLTIGERVDLVILHNHKVTIKGFLNDVNPSSSNIIFEGLEKDVECKKFQTDFHAKNLSSVAFLLKDKSVDPLYIATTAYMFNNLIHAYEEWKSICDMMPSDNKALICEYIRKSTHEREIYKIGGQAYNFEAEDKDGNIVSLTDFAGKFVLIDFWASWCGPCIKEMQNIKKIFERLESDDIRFVSISLDDTKEKWLKAMDKEKITWVSLWDKNGFKNTILQSKYGFNQIPFIVFIDKEGRTVARNLRGNDIETIIKKALDNKL